MPDSMIEDFRQILPGSNLPEAALAVAAVGRGDEPVRDCIQFDIESAACA